MKLSRIEKRWLDAVVDALLPGGCGDIPGGKDVGAVESASAVIEESPADVGIALRCGLLMIQLYPMFRNRLKPFTSLDIDAREATLAYLADHRFYLVRQSVLFVKIVVCSVYGREKTVLQALGCARPE